MVKKFRLFLLSLMALSFLVAFSFDVAPVRASPIDDDAVLSYDMETMYNATALDDLSPNTNYGNITGATSVAGKYGLARDFDGTSDYVNVADHDSLDGMDELTLMAWIYPHTWGGGVDGFVLNKEESYRMRLCGDDNYKNVVGLLYNSTIMRSVYSAADSITLNTWQHVALVYDGTFGYFYIDGVRSGDTQLLGGSIDSTSNDLWIGRDWYMNKLFDGVIDDVHIYDSALTQTQIQNAMNKLVFRGVYDEDTGLLKDASERAVNVTAYYSDGTASDTFEVNGTYEYGALNSLLYFSFNTSLAREYWVSGGEWQTGLDIYIFDQSLTAYYLTFLDLAGVLEDYAWISASRYINGTLTVVEKRKVDVLKSFTMSLKNGVKYTIQVEAEAGTPYTFGDLLMTSDTTVELIIKGVEFPKETLLTYKNVRIYGTRTLHTGWAEAPGETDQQQTTGSSTFNIYGDEWWAQSYTPTVDRQTKVALYAKKTGYPADDFYVEIRKDDSGDPDMTAGGLVASKSLSSGNFSASYGWVEFDHSDFEVAESTYWILMKSPGSGNPVNCYNVAYSSANPYAGGKMSYSNDGGSSWSPQSANDCQFKTYGFDEDDENYQSYRTDTVTVTYEDLLAETVSVAIYINYKNGTNAYNATETADSFVHSWTSAISTSDYAVVVNLNHAKYGTWTWKQYFPRAMSEVPWGLDWLGTLPFDTSVIVPAFIIIFVAGCFSVLNAEVGAFMAVVTAIVLTYMGWIPIPPGILITAIALAILMGLIYAKRRVQM